jgi:hypothetical protein
MITNILDDDDFESTRFGLGLSISSYFLLKSISKRFDQSISVGPNNFEILLNCFENLDLDTDAENFNTLKSQHYPLSLNDNPSYQDIINEQISDNTVFVGWCSPKTAYDSEYFEEVRKDFTFRPLILEKCQDYLKQFDGQKIAALHMRRGDFVDVTTGVFLCGDDYFLNCISHFDDDTKFLIFTNDKEYVKNNENFQGDRFHLVEDIYFNDNQPNNPYVKLIDEYVEYGRVNGYKYSIALDRIADQYEWTVDELIEKLPPEYVEKINQNYYNSAFDFCLMSMCKQHILSNGVFGFWAARLADSEKVIYPMYCLQDSYVPTLQGGFSTIKGSSILVRDLGTINQAKEICGDALPSHWVGMPNPDSRKITIIT